MMTAWTEYTNRSQEATVQYFWNDEINCFNHNYPLTPIPNFYYWWFAHAIDAQLDAYQRTNDKKYLVQADKTLMGVMKLNGDKVTHNWYDDMEWFALALLRFYDCTKDEKYKNLVDILWQDIQTAWNDCCGGGLAWRKDQLDYKNTPANAPAAILAARLYQRFGNAEDLAWAKKIFAWNQENLQDPSTSIIWDGMNREQDMQIDKGWLFTYNQGVMIGAAVELYCCTKDAAYMDTANKIFNALNLVCNANGILQDEGKGDGGLFKGILIRNLILLAEQSPETKPQILDLFQKCGKELVQHGTDTNGLFGPGWDETPSGIADLSAHLSGVMLLEGLCKLS